MEFQKERDAEYDAIFSLHVKTVEGFYGRIIQDVVTQPTRKWARVQGTKGALEWHANQGDKGDVVQLVALDGKVEEFLFPKTRPDDFIREMEHIDGVLSGRLPNNSIGLEQGIATMRVIAAGYQASSAKIWTDVKL